MCAEDVDAAGAFDEFHRRGPARVDFDGKRDPTASDEVDPVHPDEAKIASSDVRERVRRVHQTLAIFELWIGSGSEDVAAVAVPVGTEPGIADQLTRDPQRNRATRRSDEHHRTRDAVDPLLHVETRSDGLAWLQKTDAVAAAGAERLQEPSLIRIVRRVRLVHGRDLQSVGTEHPGDQERIARAAEDAGS